MRARHDAASSVHVRSGATNCNSEQVIRAVWSIVAGSHEEADRLQRTSVVFHKSHRHLTANTINALTLLSSNRATVTSGVGTDVAADERVIAKGGSRTESDAGVPVRARAAGMRFKAIKQLQQTWTPPMFWLKTKSKR